VFIIGVAGNIKTGVVDIVC